LEEAVLKGVLESLPSETGLLAVTVEPLDPTSSRLSTKRLEVWIFPFTLK
jgi:hypothetical protein